MPYHHQPIPTNQSFFQKPQRRGPAPKPLHLSIMRDPPERLRKAVLDGNLPITKRLLARFPELWLNTDPENKGWCNLHYASFMGNYLVCFHLMLLKKRAHLDNLDLDMVTFDDLTVLHMPVFRHHLQTLHYLLQEFSGHPWINHKGGELGRTPLHYCCVYSFTDGLKLLLEFGADWRMTDLNGDTCLHLSFAYGDLAGLRELVKCIVAKCYRSLQDAVGQPQFSEKEAVLAELDEFEDLKNVLGFKAIDYAATFELQAQYKESRLSWVEAALVEENLIRKLTLDNWDSVLAFTPTEIVRHDNASLHPSTQSLASSLNGTDSASLPYSSMKPSALPEKSDEALTRQARMHLASVGNDSSISPLEKLNSRRRSHTAAVTYKPPPLPILVNTAGAKPSVKMSSPVTPLLTDFPKTPSLKSVTISPSVRGSKRRPSMNSISGTPEAVREQSLDSLDEESHSSFPAPVPEAAIGLPIPVTAVSSGSSRVSVDPMGVKRSTSQTSMNQGVLNQAPSQNAHFQNEKNTLDRRRSMSAVQSPPIRSSSFHFLPLGISRRRSITSAGSNGTAEAAEMLRLGSPLSTQTPRFTSRRNSLRRNISTPSVIHSLALGMSSSNGSLETLPSQSQRLYRHANASDSMIRSRPSSPLEHTADSINDLLDTINLGNQRSHDPVPEDQVVHSFVAAIPRENVKRSGTVSPTKERRLDGRTSTMSSLSSVHTQRDLNSIKLTRVRDD